MKQAILGLLQPSFSRAASRVPAQLLPSHGVNIAFCWWQQWFSSICARLSADYRILWSDLHRRLPNPGCFPQQNGLDAFPSTKRVPALALFREHGDKESGGNHVCLVSWWLLQWLWWRRHCCACVKTRLLRQLRLMRTKPTRTLCLLNVINAANNPLPGTCI